MKLNKVLALALSGVMAVSMLAGCSGNPGNGGQGEGEQTPATGIVAAVNNGQDADNDVKINFTANTTLDSQLARALAAAGENAEASEVRKNIVGMIDDSVAINATNIKATLNPGTSTIDEDGKQVVGVAVYKTTDNYSETAAENEVVKYVNNLLGNLVNDWSAGKKVDDDYAAFGYAGNVSMTQVTKLDGTTCYYAAIVITVNCTLKTVTV